MAKFRFRVLMQQTSSIPWWHKCEWHIFQLFIVGHCNGNRSTHNKWVDCVWEWIVQVSEWVWIRLWVSEWVGEWEDILLSVPSSGPIRSRMRTGGTGRPCLPSKFRNSVWRTSFPSLNNWLCKNEGMKKQL